MFALSGQYSRFIGGGSVWLLGYEGPAYQCRYITVSTHPRDHDLVL
jgi:hypothetical protein